MIGIAFAGLRDKEARQAAVASERARKLESAAREAQDRIKEEGEEWDMADVEEGDGGIPVAIEPQYPIRSNAAARQAAEQEDVRRAQTKAEREWTATGGGVNRLTEGGLVNTHKSGVSYAAQPMQVEQSKPVVPPVETVNHEADSEPMVSVDQLSTRMKAKIAAMETDDEGEGGVKLPVD